MDKIKMVADGVLLVMGLVFATSFIVMGLDVVAGYALAGVAGAIGIVAALVSFVAGELEERKEAARQRERMEAKMQTASVFKVKVLDADTGEIKWGRVSAKTQMEAKMKVAQADNGSGRYAILSIEKI